MRLHQLFVSLIVLLVAVACADTGGEEVVPPPTLAAAAATVTAPVTPAGDLDVPPTFTPLPATATETVAAPAGTATPSATMAVPTVSPSPAFATPTLVSFLPPPATPTLPSPTPLTPEIQSFEVVAVEEMGTGRRLTFRWRATGTDARLFSGTAQRLAPWWVVPVSGELTVELTGTYYRNPEFTLHVFAGDPDSPSPQPQATATVQVEWPCALDYFFSPSPRRCPLEPPTETAAAEQHFEGGFMLWLDSQDAIFVLYQDGSWQRYSDTWDENQPELDPSLDPPDGRYQPRRGFGLIWREQPGVRDLLGWALDQEQGFNSAIQPEHHEGSSSGAPTYVRLVDDSTISLHPFWTTAGSWHYETQ